MYSHRAKFLSLFVALAVSAFIVAPASAQIVVTDWQFPPPGGHMFNYDPVGNSANQINGTLDQPTGMVVGPDGLLYVSNLGTNTVDKYNAATGAFVGNVISSAQFAAFNPTFQPTGLKFGPDGKLYVSSQVGYPTVPTTNTGGVYRYDLGTNTLSSVVPNLTQAEGLLFVGNTLYIAELNNYFGRILKSDLINPPTIFIDNGALGSSQLGAGLAMTIGPNGNMFVADVLGQAIREYDLLGNLLTANFTTGGHILSPADIVFADGFLYVANIGTGSAQDGFVSQFNATTGAWVADVVNSLFYASAIVAVPEPSAMILLGAAAGAWYVRRRRRNV